jgi:hypothetical protein
MSPLRMGLSAALVALMLAGCGIFPSAYRVRLDSTTWTVTALDGQTVSGATIAFNENDIPARVTVRTPCGVTDVSVDMDSDGDGIEFGIAGPRALCPVAERQSDDDLLFALERVESWQVDDDDHIRFVGPQKIEATRLPER